MCKCREECIGILPFIVLHRHSVFFFFSDNLKVHGNSVLSDDG